MGLKDLVDSDVNQWREYSKHPREEEFMEYVEELQERFPREVQVDFIEVSPRMTKYWGYAYSKYNTDDHFIRLGKDFIEEYDNETVKLCILHEMVHLYLNQIGYGDLTERDPLFTWVLGQVGADVDGYNPNQKEWKEVVEPFLDM